MINNLIQNEREHDIKPIFTYINSHHIHQTMNKNSKYDNIIGEEVSSDALHEIVLCSCVEGEEVNKE